MSPDVLEFRAEHIPLLCTTELYHGEIWFNWQNGAKVEGKACVHTELNCISFISLGNEAKQTKVAFPVLFWSLNYWPGFQTQNKQLILWP